MLARMTQKQSLGVEARSGCWMFNSKGGAKRSPPTGMTWARLFKPQLCQHSAPGGFEEVVRHQNWQHLKYNDIPVNGAAADL